MSELIISLRRHAKTDKSGVEANEGEIRCLAEEGKRDALALGKEIDDNPKKYGSVIAGYSARNLRAQETLLYLMHGVDGCQRIASLWDYHRNELSEPIITPEYAKLKNHHEDGSPRDRTERFLFYLNNEDPAGCSTKPIESAQQASYFVSEMAKRYKGCGSMDMRSRIEAITNAPKQECFLHAFNPEAFIDLLKGKTFGHLEALEVIPYGNVYVARFRDKEMQIKASDLENLAEKQSAMNDFLERA